MRILFVANTHMNLYKDIQEEMERQGHTVTFIEDTISPFDPSIHNNLPIPLIIRSKIWQYSLSKKWKRVARQSGTFSQGFDFLFVLSGVSVNGTLISLLKKRNPAIKKVLYTWDPCNSYPFDRILPLFDKAYTFDMYDAQNDNRWRLLPIYYKVSNSDNKIKYDIFSVGSNRPGRYSFIKKILPQIEQNNLISYIKIVAPVPRNSIKRKLLSFLFPVKRSIEEQESFDFAHGLVNPEILLRTPIGHEEYDKISLASRVILDDQKEGQYGLTARFMWAIGNRKKIITTNRFVYNYSFVDKNMVALIDKDNPILPVSFIQEEDCGYNIKGVYDFRIDNWVKTILS